MLRSTILKAVIFAFHISYAYTTLHPNFTLSRSSTSRTPSLPADTSSSSDEAHIGDYIVQGVGGVVASSSSSATSSILDVPLSSEASDTLSLSSSNTSRPLSKSIIQDDLTQAPLWAGTQTESFTTITESGYDSWESESYTLTFTSTSFLNASYPGYTGPSTGTGSLFAQSCNAASQVWSAIYASLTTSITTTAITTYSYITDYPPGPYSTFTLCDNYPRAHGSPNITRVLASSTHTTAVTVATVSANPRQPPPACSIDSADCEQLWSSYMLDANFILDTLTITGALQLSIWGSPEKYSYWKIASSDFIAPHTPACPSSDLRTFTSTCNEEAQYYLGDAASENSCLMYSGSVRLLYFPPDDSSGEFCHANDTLPLYFNNTAGTPTTVEQFGTTFTSGTAYLSFETLYAKDRCGKTIGTPISDYFYALPSSEVTTECAGSLPRNGLTSQWISAVEQPIGPINYNYLDGPVPASVYKCMPNCNGGLPGWQSLCPTIWDNYNPVLAFPTSLLNLQDAWAESNCYFDTFSLFELNGGGNILFDPPYLLTPANAPAAVTSAPSLMNPTSTAVPAAAPYPSNGRTRTSPDPISTPQPASSRHSQHASSTAAPTAAPPRNSAPPSPDPAKSSPGDPQDPAPGKPNDPSIGAPQNPSHGSDPAGTSEGSQGDPADPGGAKPPIDDPSSGSGKGGADPGKSGQEPDPNPKHQVDPSKSIDPSSVGGNIASILVSPPGASDPAQPLPIQPHGNEGDPHRAPVGESDPSKESPDHEQAVAGSPAAGGNAVHEHSMPLGPLATVDGHTISAGDPARSGVVIDGSSLNAGDITTLAGTPISNNGHSIIIGALNTIPHAYALAHHHDPLTTIDSTPIFAAPTGYIIGSHTLLPGASTTLGTVPLSVASNGDLIFGSATTIPLPTLAAADAAAVFTFAHHTYTAHPARPLVLGSVTLTPGGPAVTATDGEVVSMGPAGVVLDGSTITFSDLGIAAGAAVGEAVVTLADGQVETAVKGGAGGDVVFGSATLTPGEVTRVEGEIVSLGTDGALVVGGETVSFWSGAADSDGSGISGAVVTLDGRVMTVREDDGGKEVVFGDGIMMTLGESTTLAGGETAWFGARGLVIDGSTVQMSAVSALATDEAWSSMVASSGADAGKAAISVVATTSSGSGIGNGEDSGASNVGSGAIETGASVSGARGGIMLSWHGWSCMLLIWASTLEFVFVFI